MVMNVFRAREKIYGLVTVKNVERKEMPYQKTPKRYVIFLKLVL